MFARRRLPLAALVLVVLVVVVVLATSGIWLRAIGASLVSSETPERADAVLVLAGDYRGSRVMTGCELVRQGFAPVVLVSGPAEFYGINEADAAIRFATSRGCRENWLRPIYINALSTTEEASRLDPELQRLGIRRLLIVTSNYHTSRTRGVFANHFGDRLRFRMVAAPDKYFSPETWWNHREGQKTVFFEISKTLAWWMGF